VIERHGGTIVVQRTPEQRTRFSFTLPIQSGAA
jgi:signal transduction histidine kinase